MSTIALLQEEWRGWNSLSIRTALLHARIVPELGGRTMEYLLGEHAFLWSDPQLHALPSQESCELWVNWGGDKVWLAPQGWEGEDQWAGPPDPVLDGGPFDAEVEAGSDAVRVRLTSQDDPRSRPFAASPAWRRTSMNMTESLRCVVYALCAFWGTASMAAQADADASDIRTPAPLPAPHINGPKVYGARPGHDFLYRIPCTGLRPIAFAVRGLPAGLHLDAATGIISGRTPLQPREYALFITAKNTKGVASRPFKIVVGETLGLTPQMGWNDWYTHYEHISDADVRTATDAMIRSGMADFGYQFVSIDDAWERRKGSSIAGEQGPTRSPGGDILPNTRFPDMKALTAYIHAAGLKAGIYSSPGPVTCAKFEASFGHEAADAAQVAAWGFDLLKYDMCSYRGLLKTHDLAELQEPYGKMGAIVRKLDRDVVLNMCQYGMGDVWKWGKSLGGSSWRTTGDLGLAKDDSKPGFYSIGLANAALGEYAGPGGWNDPDYILIGTVGDAHKRHAPPEPTKLTHDEQYSYMSMWSMMASPLFFSGDMTRLDAFTLNVLNNAEVTDIDQDSLGKQARIVRQTPTELVLAKPLEDGSVAVGFFNLGSESETIQIDLAALELRGPVQVRDVWRQRSLGNAEGSYSAPVSAHGVLLVLLQKGSATQQRRVRLRSPRNLR